MDSYSSSFGYKHKYGNGNVNVDANSKYISELCKKEKWQMNALEQSECLSDDITVIAYLMLFIFYIMLFSSLELRR